MVGVEEEEREWGENGGEMKEEREGFGVGKWRGEERESIVEYRERERCC